MRTVAALFISFIALGTGDAAAQEPRRLDPGGLRSAELRAVRRAVRADWQNLRRSIRSTRHHNHRERAFLRRGVDIPKVLRAQFTPDPEDFVWYERASIVTERTNLFEKSFGELEQEITESDAGRRFAAAIAAHVPSSGLVIYAVHCGWGDAVGGASDGVVIYDPDTDELLWYAREEWWSEG